MTITNKYKRVALSKIVVDRSERQRQAGETLDVSDIKPSILRNGVIQAIIVEELGEDKYRLIAGERRFTASLELGLPDIPVRLTVDLTPIERQIIELEENVKRKDLPWQDEIKSVRTIHHLFEQLDSTWTQEKTATELGLNIGALSIMLRVASEIAEGNTELAKLGGYRPAYNIIMRKDGRLIDDAMNDFLSPEEPAVQPAPASAPTPASGVRTPGSPPTATEVKMGLAPKPVPMEILPKPEAILNISFHDWIKSYIGPPFNFVHCDFPYGVNLGQSDQAGSGKQWEGYEDSEQTYWDLCSCLATNLDKVMAQSSHLFFWLSSDIERQYATIKFFREAAPSLDLRTVPLTWHKTDNKGILPDPKRGPRQVTETALIGSRGDRLIIKAVSNAYGAPTSKEIHQSEKPEPVLRHFFQMFVDTNTRMLDPTCGSGTALRAAESLGAGATTGLEINPDTVAAARIALRKFRSLRAIQRKSTDG